MNKIQNQHKMILLLIVGICVFWIGDAAFYSFISPNGSFREQLVKAALHEPFLRFLHTATFLIFGIVAILILKKLKNDECNLKKHSAAIEASMDGIAIYDKDDGYVYVNQAYAVINGYDNRNELIGKNCRVAYGDLEFEKMQQMLVPILQKSGKWRGELLARRKNGSTYIQEASASLLEDGGRICIIRDITWRKRSEERLHRSERFLNTIFNSIRDPFCVFDNEFRIIRVNEAYAQLKNKSAADLIGRKCYEALDGRESICSGCIVGKTFDSADPCAKDKLITLKDGTEIWVEIYTYPILEEEGKVSHVMEYTRDITERKKAEEEKRRLIERLEYLSRTDALTGLINRRALTDSLNYEIDRAQRYKSELALILCDIDNFKEINDTYGHDAGDRALQMLAGTLKAILRKTDIAGRYGGDEFMLILPETSIKGAKSLAEKILFEIKNIDLQLQDDKQVHLSMSIGVACLAAEEKESVDSLVKRTDDAMYISKQTGRDRVSITER